MYFPPFKGFIRVFVIVCVSIFVLQQFAEYGPLQESSLVQKFIQFFGLSPNLFFRGMVFQAFTWVFIHGGLTHLLFNMFAFWMFGSLLQESLGIRKFVWYSVWASLFTAATVILFSLFDDPTYYASTIGASGLVFAILLSVAGFYPNQTILFAFIFPMKMKYFAYLMVAIEFYFLWRSNTHGISNIAHLGGALFGWLYVFYWKRGRGNRGQPGEWLKDLKSKISNRRKKKHLRIVYPEDRTRYQ